PLQPGVRRCRRARAGRGWGGSGAVVGVEAFPGAVLLELERLPFARRAAGPLGIGAPAGRPRALSRRAERARRLESQVVVLELPQQNARAVAGARVPLPDGVAAAVEDDSAGR